MVGLLERGLGPSEARTYTDEQHTSILRGDSKVRSQYQSGKR